jgi:aldehyde dehydrogenase (NAD+)
MLAFKAAPALAAGNSIIIKASEKSPLSSLVFGKLANEAGIPPGVLNLVNGDGRTGALLASHMDIDKIAFTGSAGTGKKIAQVAASSNLKKVSLELGGKSPSIVFPDANLENAIKWCVQGITANTGQACIASSRVYVHADVKEAFVNGMKQAFESLDGVTGADLHDPGTMIGPLVDKLQHDRVAEYVKTGKSEATLVTGGDTMHGGKGCWIRPALFVDPKPGATIYQEEIFGPVVVVSEFTDEEDVIERANATPFGLSGAVFSQDINRALGVSRKIHSGTVGINCCMMIDHTVAFGGMKQSGWGRELGKVSGEGW